ncbi:tRNA phosphotransferase 1, partial [Chelydra serpentina]
HVLAHDAWWVGLEQLSSVCSCGCWETGSLVWDWNPDVRLSKALSYVLRHGAAQLGLEMGADGFVDVAALLGLPRFEGVSVADVRYVVETNEKCRFALRPHPSDGRLQIRANQGHSLQQVSELELIPLLEPTALPQTMAHGTYLRHWPAICRGPFPHGAQPYPPSTWATWGWTCPQRDETGL